MAKASAPNDPTHSSSSVLRTARSSRSRSLGQAAAITGAIVVRIDPGTKCEDSSST